MKASRRLDFAERWMRDGLSACRVPAYFESINVDMSEVAALIEMARSGDSGLLMPPSLSERRRWRLRQIPICTGWSAEIANMRRDKWISRFR